MHQTPPTIRTYPARAKARAGSTLVKLTLALSIIGSAAKAEGRPAQRKIAELDAASISTAVELFILDSPYRCPSSLKDLDLTTNTIDPWDNEYQLECSCAGITVTSAGPDTQLGTRDDIIRENY